MESDYFFLDISYCNNSGELLMQIKYFFSISAVIFVLFFLSCSSDTNNSKENKIIKLNYKITALEKSFGQSDTLNSPKAYIKIQYPVFSGDEETANVINGKIVEIIKSNLNENEKNLDFRQIMDNFINSYHNAIKEFPELNGWVNERVVDVYYDSLNILGLSFSNYSFEGGAHPNSSIFYYNFNLLNRQQINLKDIFIPGYETELERIAEAVFRKALQLPSDADLTQEGYFFENGKFKLNNNFLITENGIKFLFNTYEIAPYVFGETEVFIDYSQLKAILNPKSFISNFIK